jgi:hypothetical protein
MSRRRVILYGSSIFVTISASLELYPDPMVIPLSPPLPGVETMAALAQNVCLALRLPNLGNIRLTTRMPDKEKK